MPSDCLRRAIETCIGHVVWGTILVFTFLTRQNDCISFFLILSNIGLLLVTLLAAGICDGLSSGKETRNMRDTQTQASYVAHYTFAIICETMLCIWLGVRLFLDAPCKYATGVVDTMIGYDITCMINSERLMRLPYVITICLLIILLIEVISDFVACIQSLAYQEDDIPYEDKPGKAANASVRLSSIGIGRIGLRSIRV